MFVVVVPARAGSKRIPNKNFRPFGGSSLVEITITLAEKLSIPIVVSTDSPQQIPFRASTFLSIHHRDNQISNDASTAEEVIQDLLRQNKIPQDCKIIYLQPTSPLRTAETIKRAMVYAEKNEREVLFSASEDFSEYWFERAENEVHRISELLQPGSGVRNSQFRKPILRENGNFYIIPSQEIKNTSSLTKLKMKPFITPIEEDCDIDDAIDFEIAEILFNHRRE